MVTDVVQIKADVVILGGGIQGLWLLADLIDQGYGALVLERAQPGYGQTGHAHTFLHEGHMHVSSLRGEEVSKVAIHIEPFREAHKLWMHELTKGRLQAAQQPAKRFYIRLIRRNSTIHRAFFLTPLGLMKRRASAWNLNR